MTSSTPRRSTTVEADLQRRSERTRADVVRTPPHDVLRRWATSPRPRRSSAAAPSGWLDQLEAERRAVAVRLGGEARWIAAEDAGLYRDGLGVVPPGGLPAASWRTCRTPGSAWSGAGAAPTGRSSPAR